MTQRPSEPSPLTEDHVPLDRLIHLRKRHFPWWIVWLLLLAVAVGLILWVTSQVRPPKLVDVQLEPPSSEPSPAGGNLEVSPIVPPQPGENLEESDPQVDDEGPPNAPSASADRGDLTDEPTEPSAPAEHLAADSSGAADPSFPNHTPPEPVPVARAPDALLAPELQPPVLAARQAMAARDLQTAQGQLQSALAYARRPDDRLRIERLELARFRLERFWKGVQKALGNLTVGDVIPLRQQPVTVTQLTAESVVLKGQDGESETFRLGLDQMHPELAAGLAEWQLRPAGAAYLIDVGSFWALDKFADLPRARSLFLDAQRQGLAGWMLLPQAESYADAGSSLAEDARQPIPSPAELAVAQEQVDRVLRQLPAESTTTASPMASELLRQAKAITANPSAQYVLLQQAVKVAVQSGQPAQALEAVDELVARFRVPAPERGYERTVQMLAERLTDVESRQQLSQLLVERGRLALDRGDTRSAQIFAGLASGIVIGQTPPDLQQLRSALDTD